MPVNTRGQIMLNGLQPMFNTFDITSETTQVLWTSTMSNGSVLDINDIEVSSANPEDGVKVINDNRLATLRLSVGNVVSLTTSSRGCVFNSDTLKVSDGVVPTEQFTGLINLRNLFYDIQESGSSIESLGELYNNLEMYEGLELHS